MEMSRAIKTLLALLMIAGGLGRAGIPAGAGAPAEDETNALLDKIAEQINSYPELKNWKASVVSVLTEVDKSWKPKKVTRVLKTVRVTDKERSEEILRAEETEKGVTKDVTKKYIRESEERRLEAKKRQEEQKRAGRAADEESHPDAGEKPEVRQGNRRRG